MRYPDAPTRILTESALAVAFMPGRIAPPAWSATVIVKGTFALVPDGTMTAAEKKRRRSLTGGTRRGDPVTGVPLVPGDFAPFKPAGEWTLKGTAHAPGDAPVPSLRVGVAVDGRWKHLEVFGDRHFAGADGRRETAPVPFTQMPLDWSRSYGGPGDPHNPFGIGRARLALADGHTALPLPNVENPAHPVETPGESVPPAGFGPLDRGMAGRSPPKGDFGHAWVAGRWPGLPADFDWTHFNVAPPDQRLAGYFRGDETLAFENLVPGRPLLETRLPGVRPRAVARLHRGRSDGPSREDEVVDVPLLLDTVAIDTDEGLADLVWRGVFEVADLYRSDLSDLYLAEERVDAAPAPLQTHVKAMLALAARADAAAVERAEAAAAAFDVPTALRRVKAREEAAAGQAEATPDAAPGEAEAEAAPAPRPHPAFLVELFEKTAADLRKAGVPESLVAMVGPDMDLAAFDAALRAHFGMPPPPPPEERAAAFEAMANRSLDELEASAVAAGMDEAAVSRLLDGHRPRPRDGTPPPPPAPEAGWTRERVLARHAAGGTFRDEDLSDVDLAGADLSGAAFAGAILDRADLTGANLAKADLSGASLRTALFLDADLTEAVLAGADLAGAALDRARLARADLTAARLLAARARRADAAGAVLDGANLAGVDLAKARFADASLVGADLTRARLRKTDFRRADLSRALLEGAMAEKVVLIEAKLDKLKAGRKVCLRGAVLVDAKGPAATFIGADLEHADMRYADFPRADFTGARLVRAKAHAADFRMAALIGANLSGADLGVADLFRANLSGAILVEANLEGANAFNAEFLEAHLYETRLVGANIARTKLVDPNFAFPGAIRDAAAP